MKKDYFDEFVENLQKEIIKKEIEDHNERIVTLFHDPQNWGKLEDEKITISQSYQGKNNETMQFFLKINDNDIIEKANFITDGCGCMVATGCQTTLLIEGKSIEFAERLKPEEIDGALNGLPADEKHCADLAIKTLRRVIEKYKFSKSVYKEDIDIPIEEDNINLKGTIYSSKNTPLKAPFIINLPGLGVHQKSSFEKFFSEKFAYAGYYVLAYDHRGHGETAKHTKKNIINQIEKIFSDVQQVVSWVLRTQENRILGEKIALFGRSLGGAIILTQGFLDKRVKILIALCTRNDYHTYTKIKFFEELIKKISPIYFLKRDPLNNNRILISHCRDDDVIPFENLNQIKEQLGLNDENTIIYETGGHSFRGHRDEIFENSLDFLKNL